MPKASRNQIYNSAIHRRVIWAMEDREAEFARAHQDASRDSMLSELRTAAARLGHSPWPREFPGGRTILVAFSDWEEALTRADLPLPTHPDKLADFSWYREETRRQKTIHHREKAAKKQKTSRKG